MIVLLLLIAARLLFDWGPPGPPRAPWREIRYAGRTEYTVAGDTLRASSRDANSAWLRVVNRDPAGLVLRWRWRVLRHPEGADPEVRAKDDRAAGVLVVVHRSLLPWRTRALLYQWTPARPPGRWSRSPFSPEVRTLVLRDAPADSVWREEERDLAADLLRAYGRAPARIQAIGVICDTDNTGGAAAAEFGPLVLENRADSGNPR